MIKQTLKNMGKLVLPLFVIAFIAMSFKPAHPIVGNFDYQITLTVDTNNVSAIQVNLASSDTVGASTNNVLNYKFVYDNITGLPAGTIYKRIGNIIFLTLGNFPERMPIFGEYIIIDKTLQSAPGQKFIHM